MAIPRLPPTAAPQAVAPAAPAATPTGVNRIFESALAAATQILEANERAGLPLDTLPQLGSTPPDGPIAALIERAVAQAPASVEGAVAAALAAPPAQGARPIAEPGVGLPPSLANLVLGTSRALAADRAAPQAPAIDARTEAPATPQRVGADEPALAELLERVETPRRRAARPVPVPREVDFTLARPEPPPAPVLAAATSPAAAGGRSADSGTPHDRPLANLPPAIEGAAPASSEASPVRDADAPRESRVLPQLPRSNEADIVRNVQLLAERGGGRLQIQLNPPQLGGLQLQVVVSEQAVMVSIVAEQGVVADMLDRNAHDLRQALEAQGLRVDRVDIEAGSDGFARQANAEQRDGEGNEDQSAGTAGAEDESGSSDVAAPLRWDLHTLGAVDLRV